MNWNTIVDKVSPYVVKIETPTGHGTGFLCLRNEDTSFSGIATARHVVSHADEWQEPIRLQHFQSSSTVFLKEAERVIWLDSDTDSAVILIPSGKLQFPEPLIPLLPMTIPLVIGAEVGWLGFPAVAPNTLCFFSGNISARQEWRHAYLIDGVAINGVSGGPVMYSTEAEGVQIVGSVSAYVSNRATGETLPGLAIARDVSYLHDTISKIKSFDEAAKQKSEQQSQESTPPPSAEKSQGN
jgi:trypsin-like peptidase